MARGCQTSSSTWTLVWLMVRYRKVVSGKVYPGTLTHLKLELPLRICPGLSKYIVHSSLEFVPSKTSHIQTDCILPGISGFEKQVTNFQVPLLTEWGTCAMATSISEKMGGPHIEDSLSPWSWTDPPSSSRLCPNLTTVGTHS